MNRKNEGQASTDKLLRSKYIDKDKLKPNPIIPTQSKKIMIADLCSDQKLKIGELIKINELRKAQIQQLTEELTSLRSKFAECQSKLNRLQPLFQAKQLECDRISENLKSCIQKIYEKDGFLQQLRLQNKQYEKIVHKINKIALQNKGIQTQKPNTNQYGLQTKKKKKKSQYIQTEQTSFIQEYQQQQKSKRHKSQIKPYQKQQKQTNKSRQSSFSKSQLQHNSSAENNQELSYTNSKNLSVDNLCDQQAFQDLAEKLMQLKQKHMSKLKTQYEQSKARFGKDIPPYNLQPKQFHQEEEPAKLQQQLDPNDIDDNQLNLLLKSKNFSASRLLTSKGIMSSSQNSRKGSLYKKNQNQQYPQAEKYERQPLQLKDYKLNIAPNPGKSSRRTKQNEQKLQKQFPVSNYYQSDLMDIVDSLDK